MPYRRYRCYYLGVVMQIIKELLKYHKEFEPNNCYLFTANHTLNNKGELIMGKGNALAFKNTYTSSAKLFGAARKEPLMLALQSNGVIGAFQTKHHWRDPATIELIRASTEALKVFALKYPHWVFHLPYPGCGNGGLTTEQVEPIISTLPDNVLIYIKD